VEEGVTHVVAAKDGTDICVAARKIPGCVLVKATWLVECYNTSTTLSVIKSRGRSFLDFSSLMITTCKLLTPYPSGKKVVGCQLRRQLLTGRNAILRSNLCAVVANDQMG
jgi:hypothetical protein